MKVPCISQKRLILNELEKDISVLNGLKASTFHLRWPATITRGQETRQALFEGVLPDDFL